MFALKSKRASVITPGKIQSTRASTGATSKRKANYSRVNVQIAKDWFQEESNHKDVD